jgi:hypothetical protein
MLPSLLFLVLVCAASVLLSSALFSPSLGGWRGLSEDAMTQRFWSCSRRVTASSGARGGATGVEEKASL